MTITIRYMAQLKMAAGRADDKIDLAGPMPARQVLALLAPRHEESFRQLLLTPQGAVQGALLLFLGDEQITPDDLVPRREGEVLTILSPMAGG